MGIVFKLVKNYKDKGVVWVKKNTHSSLITEISSLITYHWKFPNFLRWHVWHLLPPFDNSKTLTFCEINCLSGSQLAYSRIHSRQTNFTSFFPLAHIFSQNTWWTQPRKSIRTPPTPSSSHLPQKPKPSSSLPYIENFRKCLKPNCTDTTDAAPTLLLLPHHWNLTHK